MLPKPACSAQTQVYVSFELFGALYMYISDTMANFTQPDLTLFFFKSIWTHPQGSLGCQKIRIYFSQIKVFSSCPFGSQNIKIGFLGLSYFPFIFLSDKNNVAYYWLTNFYYFLQLIFRLTPLTSAAKSNQKLVKDNVNFTWLRTHCDFLKGVGILIGTFFLSFLFLAL